MSNRFPLSHSRLEVADQCMRRFHHQFILKDTPPPSGKSKEAMDKGKAIHSLLEGGCKTGVVPDTLQHMRQMILFIYGRTGETCLEMEVALDNDLKECDWFDNFQTWWRFKMDVLMFDAPDIAHVWDWKTGKSGMDNPNPPQNARYALSVFMAWPWINTVHAKLIYIEHNKIVPNTFTREADYERLYGELVGKSQIIDLALKNKDFPASKNPLCKWCPCLPAQCEHAS